MLFRRGKPFPIDRCIQILTWLDRPSDYESGGRLTASLQTLYKFEYVVLGDENEDTFA